MAVFFKNCTVDVSLPSGQADQEPAVTREVHMQPMASAAAFDQFDVQVTNPYLLMDDPEAIEYYAEFGRVECNGLMYAIKSPPRLWNVVAQAAHIEVLLEQIRTSNAGVPEVAPR